MIYEMYHGVSYEEDYDEINRLVRDIAEDLDMKPAVLKRVYIGSGEDFCTELYHGAA